MNSPKSISDDYKVFLDDVVKGESESIAKASKMSFLCGCVAMLAFLMEQGCVPPALCNATRDELKKHMDAIPAP